MKNLCKAGILACIFSLACMAADAQGIYVRIRPSRPAVVAHRPPAPSRAHVWVNEEWVPQGGKYAWKGGYWAAPPRARAVYVQGHWQRTRRGNVWISGRWR